MTNGQIKALGWAAYGFLVVFTWSSLGPLGLLCGAGLWGGLRFHSKLEGRG